MSGKQFPVWIGILVAVLVPPGCDRSPSRSNNTSPAAASNEIVIDPIEAARASMQRGDFPAAGRWIQPVLVAEPNNALALELAGDLAVHDGDATGAVEFYQSARDASESASRGLLDKLGRQWMNMGRPFESVAVLKSAVAQYPDDADLRQKLIGLQASLGMQWEADEHLRWLVQRGRGGLNLLIILSDLNRPQTVESTCKYALEHYPNDLRPQFSRMTLPAYHGKWSDVAKQLKLVIERHPEFVPAQAYYGRAVVELDDQAAIQPWIVSVPAGIKEHPQYWLAAGIWAERREQPRRAAHAYWQAVRLNENDGEALSRLAAALVQIGRTDQSKIAAQRAAKLAEVRAGVDSLLSWRHNSQAAAVKIAQSLEQLGRRWEATAWLQEAFRMTQNRDPKLSEIYQPIRARLTGQTPWQLRAQMVAANMDLSDFPSLDWSQHGWKASSEAITATTAIRFTDQALQRNLKHICSLGKPTGEESGLAIYQSGAGGAGVIDFDLDGWPDVYLTAMDGTPKANDSSPNRFFRNRSGQFAEITDHAGLGDRGFAQGIAVGDYNADGLADIFVGNIGRNRLYRNNGDGTFADVTDEVGLSGTQWTTSVAVADIDGDAYADFVELGYCGGQQPYQQDCIDPQLQQPRSCSPLAFDAQRDRIWRGRGDGTFVDVTDQWLATHDGGRGLGIVAGQLDQQPGLDILIANDMTANHYWTRDTSTKDAFRLAEQASVRGLALNERSLAQASMGIAAGDADGDGDVDFLLTHFVRDHNTFYEQVSPGVWMDHSRRAGLVEPSHEMLGYGTQWIDADNDGWPELLIANGDIDDFTHEQRLYRQPFQVFNRTGNGRWVELDPASLGKYFTNRRLARAVVTLDANRDGRLDFLVTHLFDPVALLVNQTDAVANQVRFFVRGTRSDREAIGTTVTLGAGGRRQVQQVFAGDGFQCSNERCVSFGVGDLEQVDDVTVVWPDGSIEELGHLKTGNDYLVIEGSKTAFGLQPASSRTGVAAPDSVTQ